MSIEWSKFGTSDCQRFLAVFKLFITSISQNSPSQGFMLQASFPITRYREADPSNLPKIEFLF